MRFLLIVTLAFAGAGQVVAVPANGRVAKLLQKMLPAESASMISKKAGKLVAGAGLVGLALCGTITGCDRGEQILIDVVDVEEVDNVDGRDSQYVSFIIGNTRYEGYWEDTQTDQLLVELDTGGVRIVLLEQVDGFLVPNHHDIGALVYLIGEANGEEIYRYGEVVDVYDNGYYSIEISYEEYVDNGERINLFRPYTMLVHQAVLLDDGGFAFEE